MKAIIKPEFLNKGETSIIYDVVEDNGDRCLISPEQWDYEIKPIENVSKDMLIITE